MSDDVIRVGDLVVVTSPMPCCGASFDIGIVFRVSKLYSEYTYCEYCDCGDPMEDAYVDDANSFPKGVLTKIKPLDETVEDAVLVPEVVGV